MQGRKIESVPAHRGLLASTERKEGDLELGTGAGVISHRELLQLLACQVESQGSLIVIYGGEEEHKRKLVPRQGQG